MNQLNPNVDIPFAEPRTGELLVLEEADLVEPSTGRKVAQVKGGIPRFVDAQDDYAESFGWQWNRWEDALSDSRTGTDAKRRLLLERTRFGEVDLSGRTVLECGMGGGDDTEVLLTLPFAEVHSFDLSSAVDRARRVIEDPRLVLSQASIFDIPYRDEAFDVVFCHRVIQHTPDPLLAIARISQKVKPGGLLFVHSYHRSLKYMLGYKYRYRFITRRLRSETVFSLLERHGPRLHRINQAAAQRGRVWRFLASMVVPFEPITSFGQASPEEVFEVAKLVTFDALTPRYDKPMRARDFRAAIEEQGFEVLNLQAEPSSPLWCTARRIA